MPKYSIMLDVKERDAIVVGGGQVAYRKVVGLLQAGASVTVVSPNINEDMQHLHVKNMIVWKEKVVEKMDIQEAFIVIAATNDQHVNERIASFIDKHQLINVVDHPKVSNFHVPATLERGDLTISVATGGASPILAKVIRDELAERYSFEYEDYLTFLSIAREKVKKQHITKQKKRELLQKIIHPHYRQSKQKQINFLQVLSDD